LADNELSPEIQKALEEAALNGQINAMDEAMVKTLLGIAMMLQDVPEEEGELYASLIGTFLITLGHYRDSWMERVLIVIKQEQDANIDRRLAELREGLGDSPDA
jgi:hypothetical protein